MDYLVNVDYNDGLNNEYQTWTYDDAGNRASDSTVSGSWTYDNLNRMTASPGYSSYTNDILGNRTARQGSGWPTPTPATYQWDALNRMTYFSSGVGHDDYMYRADGMRVYKNHVSGLAHEEGEADPGDVDYSARFFYDGQMQVESKETYLSGNNWLTKYGIGARGIDYLERTYNGGTATVAFPIYDGHGNMIATIGRSGSSYAIGDQREYDVWGKIRSGNTTGDPKPRYCANLGHVQDDESGLIYMRARYYEPWTGRFVSEDKEGDGRNWYIYCRNQPVSLADPSGNSAEGWDSLDHAISIAKKIAKQFGYDWHQISASNKAFMLFVAYVSDMIYLAGLVVAGNAMVDLGASGLGTGLIFAGNPVLAGLSGAAIFAGGLMVIMATMAMAILTYQLGYNFGILYEFGDIPDE